MQRDSRAYLNDIIEAAAAIQAATVGVTIETYSSNRLIRSAVEREFITIGEALRVISQQAPDLFNRIPEAGQIIDFIVWGCIQADLPPSTTCRGSSQRWCPQRLHQIRAIAAHGLEVIGRITGGFFAGGFERIKDADLHPQIGGQGFKRAVAFLRFAQQGLQL